MIAKGIRGIRKDLNSGKKGWHIIVDDRYVGYNGDQTFAEIIATYQQYLYVGRGSSNALAFLSLPVKPVDEVLELADPDCMECRRTECVNRQLHDWKH